MLVIESLYVCDSYRRWTFWSWIKVSWTCVRHSSLCWRLLSRWTALACYVTALMISWSVAFGLPEFHSGIFSSRRHTAFFSWRWNVTPPSSTQSGLTPTYDAIFDSVRCNRHHHQKQNTRAHHAHTSRIKRTEKAQAEKWKKASRKKLTNS